MYKHLISARINKCAKIKTIDLYSPLCLIDGSWEYKATVAFNADLVRNNIFVHSFFTFGFLLSI